MTATQIDAGVSFSPVLRVDSADAHPYPVSSVRPFEEQLNGFLADISGGA